MFSTPFTSCSIGAATVSATTFALAPEDRVVVAGIQRVRPGILVDAQPVPAAPAVATAGAPPAAD